jgi:hypothetical protein
MRTAPNKAMAVLVIIITTFGLLLSLFFLIQTWRYRVPVTEKLRAGINQTSAILETTGEGLEILDQVVKNVYTSTVYLDESATTLSRTFDSTSQFMDNAGTFMGENLVNTITNTQSAIDSAQSSAVVIDNILTTLSRIPLIGIDYNPSKPLNVTLGEVSDSLDPMQRSLESFQSDIGNTQSDLEEFKQQILILDQNITAISRNLKATQVTIDHYRTQLSFVQSWTDTAQTSLSRWMTGLAWMITFIIIWLIFIQVAILLQAINQISMIDVVYSVPEKT